MQNEVDILVLFCCFQPTDRDRWDQVFSVNGERYFPGPVNGGGKVPQPVGRTPIRPKWEQYFGRPASVCFCSNLDSNCA